MRDWKARLRDELEPLLSREDPRPDISAYKDMPLCIFLYDPAGEFALRQELSLLKTRLEQKGKRIITISLMECMMEALANAGVTPEDLVENETMLGRNGHKQVAQTIHQVLSEYAPLDQLVLSKVPESSDPLRDVLWITRAGALYPCYRTSTLIEHFQAKLEIPGVLFYPGEIVPPAGLSFMGVHEAEHNYRAKIL
ncbi:BREX protein BrxB domain-containing protein [Aeoliella sp.]|uniref:BREX protein BrxB domain-containing protein n=1 Tax=Aeoliella sp. TaxID=2795800 RepID=UPI003CCC45FC